MKYLALILALLIAPPAHAQAMWALFMAHGVSAGSVTGAMVPQLGYFTGQARPRGPIQVNYHSPYAPLASMIDSGNGIYVSPTFIVGSVVNGQVSAIYGTCSGSTTYGFSYGAAGANTAALWPGLGVQGNCAGNGAPNMGARIKTGSDSGGVNVYPGILIDKASNLASGGAGMAYTVAMQVVRISGYVGAQYEMYGARTWISDGEGWPGGSTPGVMWGFVENAPSGGGNYAVGAYVVTGSVGSPTQAVIGTFTITPNVFYTLALDCINVSSGSANCEWFVNGVKQSGTLSGVALPSTQNSGETDMSVGVQTHDAGLSQDMCACYVPKLDFLSHQLSPTQEWVYAQNPWIGYKPLGAP